MAKRPVKTQPEPRTPCLSLLGAALLALGMAGHAQAQTVRIQPSLDNRLTWTDNVDTSATDKQKDWIAEISPGLSISRESGRFSGGLDMRLRNLAHAERTEDNTTYLALQGRGTLEAIEDAFFVDLAASISRDNRSAFSGRFGGDTLDTDENNETRLFSIAPRFAFRFGASGEGRIGYQQRWLTGGDSTLGDQRSGTWQASVTDPVALRLFGWGLDYVRTDTRYDEGSNRDVEQEVGRATLFVNIDPQFRVRAIGGYESNDYATVSGERGAIWGAGFDWYPNERTAISVTGEDRIFGTGYDVSLQHRMARSALTLTARRDISSSLQDLAGGYAIDPLFQAIYQILGAIDPTLSDLERERIALDEYRARGGQGIRSNAYFLERAFGAGYSISGVRNTVSISLQQSERQRLSTLSGFVLNDDLADYDKIRTRSASLSFNHQLSGLATLSAGYLRSRSEGEGVTDDTTTRSSYTLGLTRRLGAQANGGVTYSHIKSEGRDAYTENAVTATFGMRF